MDPIELTWYILIGLALVVTIFFVIKDRNNERADIKERRELQASVLYTAVMFVIGITFLIVEGFSINVLILAAFFGIGVWMTKRASAEYKKKK
ncbi:hypothetical protein CEY16_11160 [Halalkalibacillus sediminis]|uniref:YtpI-like protein n=1 Tax=Halalkalibacillus sediminis TaxID=2018042 RepID=A0A2I0QSK6_9BACI|nr:hypothetical protein [Halalkalibacillus sediminis]PKR77288.1 hypothetical protein CEY16_11160 [Halalkalibacillus sediminis]